MNNSEIMDFLRDRREDRRKLIRRIIHECPKLSGEPSADCVGALSGVAVAEAQAALAAAGVDDLRAEIARLTRELNAHKDALAQATAEIAALEGKGEG